ncbi:MAG TPA: condensation domain-containing protein, partial [Rhizomicrobium sp.]
MWFLDRLGLGSAYHISGAFRLEGRLDVEALEAALTELDRRHESLRTRFEEQDGELFQLVDAPRPVELQILDLSSLNSFDQAQQLQGLIKEETSRAFDLTSQRLLRTCLARLGDEDHILIATIHHIISDGWSMGVLTRELAALYDAYSQRHVSPLPEPELQYADYALWQRLWLQGETLERQVAYWRERLSGAPTALELPTDRRRPAMANHRGASIPVVLSKALSEALAKLGREKGATPFMVLLAAFQAVLSRWSGQDDVVVGVPITGRTRRQTEDLIGFFVNTLAMRTDLSGDPSFEALLARVKNGALEAYAHQDLPFEKLVSELAPARDLGRHPLFQVMFVLQNIPPVRLELNGVRLNVLEIESQTAKFDLTLTLSETAQGLAGSFEYATDLFDASTIERLANHLCRALEQVTTQPELKLSQLDLLSTAERHQLLAELNATEAPYRDQLCVHQLFEEQAAADPDAVALIYEDQSLSYGELNARA